MLAKTALAKKSVHFITRIIYTQVQEVEVGITYKYIIYIHAGYAARLAY